MLTCLLVLVIMACSIDNSTATDDQEMVTELHAAFDAFNTDAVTIYLDDDKVVIETTGLPNHKTVYWGAWKCTLYGRA